jgi:hypothetical protein
VDGVSVRPLEQGGRLTVPLLGTDAFDIHDGPEVEIVSVEEQAIALGRSQLDLGLTRVDLPVLEHRWQLLLPEGNRYRYSGGDLRPAPPPEIQSSARVLGVRIGGVTSGEAGVEGVVNDVFGEAIPGVSVIAAGQTAFTDANGRFLLLGLPPGRQKVHFMLSGMITVERDVTLESGRIAQIEAELQVASVEETIVLTAEVPTSRTLTDRDLTDAREAEAQFQYRQNISVLNQGAVGGVRPLPVEIPETGKGLFLAGTLPPATVTARLEVKRKR